MSAVEALAALSGARKCLEALRLVSAHLEAAQHNVQDLIYTEQQAVSLLNRQYDAEIWRRRSLPEPTGRE